MENIRLKMSLFRELKGKKKPVKSEYAIFCAIGIYMNYKEGINYSFTPRILYNSILGKKLDTKVKSIHIEGIKSGMEELKQKKWINYTQVGTFFCVTYSELFDENELWFPVPKEYIEKVVNTKNGIKLLHYYLFLISTINLERKCGFMSQENISKTLGIAKRTVINRNQKLIDLEVMYFMHRSDKDLNGNFINLTNLYYLPENQNLVVDFKEESIANEVKLANKKIMKERKSRTRGIKKETYKDYIDIYRENNSKYTDIPF